MNPARVLVTGARGFIGSHLADRLLQAGHEVWGYSRSAPASAGPIRYVTGELSELAAEARWPQRFDAIFHLGGMASVQEAEEDLARALIVNGAGTARVLAFARQLGAPPVVLISSVYVYDGCTTWPWQEGLALAPRSALGASKLAAEAAGRVFAECHGLRVCALRLFTVYGPRSRPSQFIPAALQRILQAEGQVTFTHPDSTRDFVYVEDVVEACLRAWPRAQQTPGMEIFNVGSGIERRIDETVQTLLRACGRTDVRVRFEPETAARLDERRGPTRHCADISRAREQLGWAPQTSFEEGLRRTLAWLEQTHRVAAGAAEPTR